MKNNNIDDYCRKNRSRSISPSVSFDNPQNPLLNEEEKSPSLWDLNSKPLDNRSPSITTRPGLLLLPTCKCSSSSKFFLESDLLKAYLLNMIVSVTRC